MIFANLQAGADISGCKKLQSNHQLCFMGVIPHGEGMVVSEATARKISPHSDLPNSLLRPYSNGKQLITGQLDRYVIDAFPMSEAELRNAAPAVFQWLLDTVKPLRDANRDKDLREKWWLHRRNNLDLRNAQKGLSRFIATVETSKHRTFSFLPGSLLPDQKLRVIACDDAWILSVLSSRFHVQWSIAAGGWLGVGNDSVYNGTRCFDPFPFPTPTEAQTVTLRALGEELDAHRKERQKVHPKLTLTQMYNVLDLRRAGAKIEGRDKQIYDDGLIGLLHDIHSRIDCAVAEAYGWPADLTDDQILHRLVALNHARAAEEDAGLIRCLRPDYQNPTGAGSTAQSGKLDLGDTAAPTATKPDWPKTLPEQASAVRDTLAALGQATPEELARTFKRTRAASVQPLLDSMTALGLATKTATGAYHPAR
ncbi:hypothetical protein GQF56_14995 [Rhodobacter sphaeroides]|uniref:type IIL restriction-modification enzyme MmeI n=1 Tax=Cereibacter sphaeroides TaxID=1063 RepID=UPI0011BF5D2E|nr:type IIL restriction-modification enzyme MmeI [Cereibacter sphaeroides]MVX46304.1 hypothetical protein [Cereibacter sphaeroides]MVX49170.1 hypothetical protein [Cereibacter sphaeroides]QJC85195.1 class I SAM-dependent DNA methyltransferase [Cereibacter sphaeroides]